MNRTRFSAALALAAAISAAPAAASVSTPAAPGARGIAATVAPLGNARDLGAVGAATPVRVGFLLRDRNEADLTALVRLQGERGSRYYHRYLSNAQWNAYFAPQPSDVAIVVARLRAAGFGIEGVSTNRSFVTASAPAATVERFFTTTLHRIADGSRIGVANATPATLPQELRAEVAAVSGLHTQALATVLPPGVRRTMPVFRSNSPDGPAPGSAAFGAGTAATPKPVTTSTPLPDPDPEPTLPDAPQDVHQLAYGPVAMAVSYDYPVQHGYDGAGRTVANLIDGDYLDSDLASNESSFGITRTGTTTRISVDGGAGTSNAAAQLESTLDVEVIAGLAPGANYRLYIPPVLNDIELQNGLNQIVADDLADVVSLSYGTCENYDPSLEYAEGYIAMQGAAKGITFAAATGDGGGLGCASEAGASLPGVEIPAATYYFTAVGGTDLVASLVDGSYVSEAGDVQGGAGVSIFEAQPDWQAATPGTNASGREIPDVALDDSYTLATGFQITDMGTTIPEGGTSLSTPLFSSMIAEVDQVQGARNGWLNPRLYQIYDAQGYGFVFRDVTAGTNGTQAAGPGFDALTGIGSLRGWELAGTL